MMKEILLVSCVLLALGSALPNPEERGVLKRGANIAMEPLEAASPALAAEETDLNPAESRHTGYDQYDRHPQYYGNRKCRGRGKHCH